MRRVDGLDDVTHGSSAILVERRERKMAASAHAFLRGNAAAFYEWLSERRIPKGPPLWICGDLHVGNLGPVADANGEVALEIRDFDQSVIGNPTHDVLRLAFSLSTVGLTAHLDGPTILDMLEGFAHGYVSGLERRRGGNRPKAIRFIMSKALERSWKKLFDERDIEHAGLPRNRRFLPLTHGARADIVRLVEQGQTRELVTLLGCRDRKARIALRDAAFWVKGCSSLGLVRVAALAAVAGREKTRGGLALLDFKEARRSCAPAVGHMPHADAERVVFGARALAPNLGFRMLATKVMGRSTFVRELLPQDLKLELESVSPSDATNVAAYVAHILGIAHGRQLDRAARREWLRAVRPRKSRRLPRWLGDEVAELLSRQTRAYLEHCAELRAPAERRLLRTRP